MSTARHERESLELAGTGEGKGYSLRQWTEIKTNLDGWTAEGPFMCHLWPQVKSPNHSISVPSPVKWNKSTGYSLAGGGEHGGAD